MIEVFAERRRFSRVIELFIRDSDLNSEKRLKVHFEWEKVDDEICSPPSLAIEQKAAQQLMDELWQCGIRPTEGSGSAGSLQATQNHLKDMQKISFQLLENKLGEVIHGLECTKER